ncbi:hypothetical protein PENTCL1PPCAC_5986, partial [Pristionchus entomophagus]
LLRVMLELVVVVTMFDEIVIQWTIPTHVLIDKFQGFVYFGHIFFRYILSSLTFQPASENHFCIFERDDAVAQKVHGFSQSRSHGFDCWIPNEKSLEKTGHSDSTLD